MDNDNFNQIPANVSTVADLLDTKNISWSEYQEHLPYPGFQGFNYSNQETFANDYVRKHNPLVLYDSVVKNETRARQIKNFTDFESDLSDKKLPQWAFITPNMTNDAHDTNITFAAKWERSWMSSLLKNDYFMNDSLILLTFDEDDTYNKTNRVFRYVHTVNLSSGRRWRLSPCCLLRMDNILTFI
jgi:acid phosphatase